MMRLQRAFRQLFGPAPLAGPPIVIGLMLLAGCGDESSKPVEPSGTSPPPAVKTEPAAAKDTAKDTAKATPKAATGPGKIDLGPDMSARERRALRKAGKLKD